jgi:RimJ/RimL family protein N-acetyltransferase
MVIPELPPVLEGIHVRLEPLTRDHIAPLTEVGLDPDLWQWTMSQVHSPADMVAYVEAALAELEAGQALPFATLDRQSGRVVGSTRFGSLDRRNLRVEIGWTWIARPWQRSPVNTEAKYLMLRYAFEELGCMRVELKTDALNERSRRAIARLGAVEEGVLRSHMVAAQGRVRDTVYYSIIAPEWPTVRARLETILGRPAEAAQ